MKITKRQLRRIIKEMHPRAGADDAYVADLERQEEELATQIRHASKDIHGRKDMYDLGGKSVEELEDILFDLGNSPEQRGIEDMYRDKEEDAMGRERDLSREEMAPQRQGMRRRSSGSKSQRRMESAMKITRGQLRKIVKEERARLLKEDEQAEAGGLSINGKNDAHHWPRVDWSNVGELTDKWIKMEEEAWDKGDTSMNPDDETDADAKRYWKDQVEGAAMDLEGELTLRVRRVALKTMEEFTEKLINGEYT